MPVKAEGRWSDEEIERYLLSMEHPAWAAQSHERWVRGCLPRFLRTLELVPAGAAGQQCLEIGAMPYTFTLLMKKFRPYALTLVDFDASGERRRDATTRLPSFGEEHTFQSNLFDIEHEPLLFGDANPLRRASDESRGNTPD